MKWTKEHQFAFEVMDKCMMKLKKDGFIKNQEYENFQDRLSENIRKADKEAKKEKGKQ